MCDVCVFHAAVFGEMKLFAVLGFFDLPFSNLNHAGPAHVTKLHCNVFKNGGGIRNFREKTGDEIGLI